MPRHRHAAVLAATTVLVLAVTAPARCGTQPDRQHARLAGLARLRAATFRPGSPASGAHFSATERAVAEANGVSGPDRGPYLAEQPVHVVDERTLLVASDNNFPFSNGRARARAVDRSGPLAADDTELALIRLGEPLAVDGRLLPAAGR